MRRVLIAAVAAFTVFATSSMAFAGHINPTVELVTKAENGGWSCDEGIKVEPVESGWYDGIHIEVDGDAFSFTTADGIRVTSVLVKGGPNALLYHYGSGTRGDSGLTAPTNTKNGKTYGLSHICFMVDDKKGGGGHSET